MTRAPIDSATWFDDAPPLEVAFTRNAESVDGEEDARLQVEQGREQIDAIEWQALLGAIDFRDWP
jgi:hypothetical protein